MDIIKNINNEFPETGIEWLETDGRGGYASSTISLLNTRKYHGLLVTPVSGLEGRYLFLSGIEPVLECDGETIEFSNSQYPGEIHPEGYKYLKSFRDYPFPSWEYEKGDFKFHMEILMTAGNGLVVFMKNRSSVQKNITLKLNFLFSLRNSHYLSKQNNGTDFLMSESDRRNFKFSGYDSLPSVNLRFSKDMDFTGSLYWINNTEYLKEYERGFDFTEDRILPGTFSCSFNKGEELFTGFCVTSAFTDVPGNSELTDLRDLYLEEKKKRQNLRKKYNTPSGKNSFLKNLKEKSNRFFITNSSGFSSIVAGYPWFGEWGRDTMIALPGLAFSNGNLRKGIEVLRGYTSLIKNGLIPNTLSGSQGFESYNSVDASLLYIWAVQQLYNTKGGKQAAFEFNNAVGGILEAFLSGRVHEVYVDQEGFISAGNSSTQLTWMDAMVNNVPVTPRGGAPVDINALWYNALRFFIEQSEQMKKDISEDFYITAEKIKGIFKDKYWNYEGGYPADTVNGETKDFSVRPNMLWAASLPHSPLGRGEKKSIIAVCDEKLLTSCGLRTLSPDDPSYEGRYSGSGNERDSKYHQGTVWPWLFGIYTEASLRAADDKKKKGAEIRLILDSFLEIHLEKNGRGFISEIFDGNNPGDGKGTFAQAWSCAEVIRSYALIEKAERGMSI